MKILVGQSLVSGDISSLIGHKQDGGFGHRRQLHRVPRPTGLRRQSQLLILSCISPTSLGHFLLGRIVSAGNKDGCSVTTL